MIKFEQSQALISHFESFWSIVQVCSFKVTKKIKFTVTWQKQIIIFFFSQDKFYDVGIDVEKLIT